MLKRSGIAMDLDDLSDVTITTPANNELLAYNTATSEWINKTPTEAGLDSVYLKLDGSNANTTINIGSEDLTTTGTAFLGLIDLGTNTIDDGVMTGDWNLSSGILTNVNIDSGTIDGITGISNMTDLILSGLTASKGVYTDGSKQLTSTAPTSGVLGHWDRTGTVLSPSNSGDDIADVGNVSMAGKFTNVMGATDFVGFEIDHVTNPLVIGDDFGQVANIFNNNVELGSVPGGLYTPTINLLNNNMLVTANVSSEQVTTNLINNVYNQTGDWSGADYTVTGLNNVITLSETTSSGEIFRVAKGALNAIQPQIFSSFVSEGVYDEFVGARNEVRMQSASSIDVDYYDGAWVGADNYVQSNLNVLGGDFYQYNYGSKNFVFAGSTDDGADSFNMYNYASYNTLYTSADATFSVATYNRISGNEGDEAWLIYNAGTLGDNFLGGDDIKTYVGTGKDAGHYYNGTNWVFDPAIVGSGGILINNLTASKLVKTDASKVLTSTDATVDVPIALTMFDAVPSRNKVSDWNGGLESLATGQQLGPTSPGDDIVVTKGTGKLVIVVNAGSDITGDITITGTSVNRDTGATTASDTDTISVDTLTTDNSTTDANGNICYDFDDAYISSKWFTGSVTLSSTTLNLSDVDVYHCSFEQWNDQSDLTLNTFDANIYTTNANAEFDAYLQTLHVTGNKCRVDCEAELHVGAAGETAIADKYWRLRRGAINEALDGTTDGMWVSVYYSNSPVYVEDVTIKVWATKNQVLTLT
ncbi:MAG: hypothetical protein ACTSWD_04920 [Candidatus Heimdallarchaeota archaeon]